MKLAQILNIFYLVLNQVAIEHSLKQKLAPNKLTQTPKWHTIRFEKWWVPFGNKGTVIHYLYIFCT